MSEAEAQRRIEQEARERTGDLDLGGLGLTRVPEGVFALTHLRRLNLGHYVRLTPAVLEWVSRPGQPVICCYNDLYRLEKFANLTVLGLQSSDITDFEPLRGFAALRVLDCGFTKLTSLVGIEALTNLQTLDCSDTQIASLAGIEALTNLLRLNCGRTQIASLAGIEALTNLQTLNCYSTQIASLAGIEALTNLQTLDCSDTQIASLAGIEALTNLLRLNCGRTQIASLAGIEALTNLQTLNCYSTQIASLAGIEALTNLQTLDCGRTQIASLAGIEALTALTNIDIENTGVRNLAPLAGLMRLRELDLRGCKIEQAPKAVWRSDALQTLYLYGASLPGIDVPAIAPGRYENNLAALLAYLDDIAPPSQMAPPPAAPEITPEPASPTPAAQGDVAASISNDAVKALREGPPPVPPQAVGLHFEINQNGIIDFAPPGALDVAGNNLGRLQAIQPKLLDVLNRISVALATLSGSNAKRPRLAACVADYLHAMEQPLWTIDRHRIVLEGLLLENEIKLDLKRTANDEVPALPAEISTDLGSAISMHHMFAMATVEGIEALADERNRRLTPREFDAAKAATVKIAEAFQDQGQIIGEVAAAKLLEAAKAIGAPTPERGFSAGIGAVGNLLITFASGASAAAIVMLVHRAAGPEFAAIASLPIIEAIKKSSPFQSIVEPISRFLSKAAATGTFDGIERLYPMAAARVAAAAMIEPNLPPLAALGDQFGWVLEPFKWIRRVTAGSEAHIGGAGTPPVEPPRTGNRNETPRLEWFVSYAWGTSRSGGSLIDSESAQRDAAVESFCKLAAARGVTIRRDINEIRYGESILAFMRKIGSADRVVVILSEKYLRSPYCMTELLLAWRASSQEPELFRPRVKVLSLLSPSALQLEARLEYAAYWQDQLRRLDRKMARVGRAAINPGDTRDYNMIQDFYQQVTAILGLFAEHALCRTPEQLAAHCFDDVAR